MLSSDLSQTCSSCFPTDTGHLKSPCGKNPNQIALPPFSVQQTANCPFLGTLTNEGLLPYDWMMNETVWRATAFASDRNNNAALPHIQGHFAGNFRDHSTWVDTVNKVNSSSGSKSTECVFWYVNPVEMEGLGNEHDSSIGISDCPTNWENCGFDCANAGEWKCQPGPGIEECRQLLPNGDKLASFIAKLNEMSDDGKSGEERLTGYVTTCELEAFALEIEAIHASQTATHIVEDFHFVNPTASFSEQCNNSFTHGDGVFLTQTTHPIGGTIGGSIVGGYKDLFQYFGEHDMTNANRMCIGFPETKYFKIKETDLERVDLERKLPCDFPRESLFEWMREHNGVLDRLGPDGQTDGKVIMETRMCNGARRRLFV